MEKDTINDNMFKLGFARRLKEVRQRADLSAEAFARVLGVHRSSVIAYEAGTSEPSVRIMEALRIADFDWIYVVTGMTAAAHAGRDMNWDLLESVIDATEHQLAEQDLQIPREKKMQIIKTAYLLAIGRNANAVALDNRLTEEVFKLVS